MRFRRHGTDVTAVTIHISSTEGNSSAGIELADVPRSDCVPKITSSDPDVVSVDGMPRMRAVGNFSFYLSALATTSGSDAVTVTVATRSGIQATLRVVVDAAIELPDPATEAGAVARLLMSEARGPSHADYLAADTLESMGWMQRALENRLAKDPSEFGARGAKNLIDIIRAANQFDGFSDYPNYDQGIRRRLQQIVNIANNDNDRMQSDFRKFIQNAVDVARLRVAIRDPSRTGLFGWRAAGTGSPGSRFARFRTLAGNTFFTLRS
ncbi:hypothetical protein WME89_05550 [Sorangium sp. So ce321]|uniref:hypothetical protein n=1 Tax=Sorangium sp. So ce321 TaxID=3133300 RepID=UPI003F62C88C